MEKLFAGGRIGNLYIKNRAVMPPMDTGFCDPDRTPGERMIRYYEERARGGMGLIIVEATCIDDEHSQAMGDQLILQDDYSISRYERLTEAVHKHDCAIMIELHSNGANSGMCRAGAPWAASEVQLGAAVPHEMTEDEIAVVVQRYVDGAVRAKKAGFDGVELHGCHSYFLYQFLSPYFNRRTDKYGGSTENRVRIFAEIIAGIKKALGKSYPVAVRISGSEFTPEIEGTYDEEEGCRIALELEKAGADAIDVSNGNPFNPNANCEPYSYPAGWKKHIAKKIKAAVSIPVIATNTIKDPEFAEQLLEEGVSDFVALGRASFADPFFMKKARAGNIDGIRKCIGCMHCRKRLVEQLARSCSVNPMLGCEYAYSYLKKDGEGRTVVVIGGGPAGMQAAKTLAERGYDVTIFDREAKLGGRLNIADRPAHKEKITGFTETMKLELEQLGVKIVLNTEAAPDMVKSLHPAGVFLACGGVPVIPPMEGINRENVFLAEDVIAGKAAPAGRVAVIGTGAVGLECAEMLAGAGCEIILADM